MRQIKIINDNWAFINEDIDICNITDITGSIVNLPHTWNASDGQYGGNDYCRGRKWYVKKLIRPESDGNCEVWLEFSAAAMVSDVYVNGHHLGHHEGGYSTFRINMTDVLLEENVIAVAVDNSYTKKVYPQKADFTFYGGIYRDVSLIVVQKEHFSLGYYGSSGVKITPEIKEDFAEVRIEAWTENTPDGTLVEVQIDDVAQTAAMVSNGKVDVIITIKNVHLWNGLFDPYLYTAKLMMRTDGIAVKFGCRTFSFDKDRGFFLNGDAYPLCGVSRHQDREGVGSALTQEMQNEDMEIMKEMGVNTIRLAHYQHSRYFYDLCDEAGIVVWAEIPYISEHMPEANDNTYTQLRELIVQNYNHPSIICWGLSNEITAAGGFKEDLIENHKRLNNLAHYLDKSRPTTMANVFMLETDSPIVTLTDIRSYNLYYGWYIGELEDNDSWFDIFHSQHPEMIIGLSEYGADGNPQYQSATPKKGDWTEGYQALYHEHMLEMWKNKPFIWAMYAWNMFDFGADGRDEGGKPGQNQKGLVTFDRKVRKDAFYIYKAYLSKTPFVHICGRRYRERAEDITEVKVYSNLPTVTLLVDEVELKTQQGDKIFKFNVPISGIHRFTAVSEDYQDEIEIQKVAEAKPEYSATGSAVTNWFEKTDAEVREGYYSLKDPMGEVRKLPEVKDMIESLMAKATKAYGDVAKNVQIPESVQKMMDAISVEDMLNQMGKIITPEIITELNDKLTEIKKPNNS